MSDAEKAPHPFDGAFQCGRFVAGVPCRCPAWQEFTHQRPAIEGGGIEVVKGCMYQLFVRVMGWAINAAHLADCTTDALRQDIQGGFGLLVRSVQAPPEAPRKAGLAQRMRRLLGAGRAS